MLARINRITLGGDLRQVARAGTKFRCDFFVASVLRSTPSLPTRFGFVTSARVGGAVLRNTVKRRLRALASQTLDEAPAGYEIVVRAQPASARASFDELSGQWDAMVAQLVARR